MDPVEHIDSPVNATSLIDCGPAVVVAVYASHAAAVAQFNSQASTMAGLKTKLHMAIGPNWTVSSDDPAYAENVAKLLTVEYRTT